MILGLSILAATSLSITLDVIPAYIDPGTGSIIIQGLIAAIAAVGVTTKLYWHRISRFLKRNNDGKAGPGKGGNSDP